MQKNSLRKKIFDPSTETHALAKKEELGELRKVYPVFKPNTTPFGIGVVCIFLSFVLIVLTIPVALGQLPLLYLLTGTPLGSILLVIGLYLTLSRRIYDRWSVSLWQYGFIYEKKQIIQAFRWNQVESVQRAVDPPQTSGAYMYRVRRQDDYEVKLGNVFPNITELIDTLLEESARQLAPQELGIQFSRSTGIFTTFKLDRQGIGNTQEALSWKEIQEFATHNGAVTLHKRTE